MLGISRRPSSISAHEQRSQNKTKTFKSSPKIITELLTSTPILARGIIAGNIRGNGTHQRSNFGMQKNPRNFPPRGPGLRCLALDTKAGVRGWEETDVCLARVISAPLSRLPFCGKPHSDTLPVTSQKTSSTLAGVLQADAAYCVVLRMSK